MITCGAQNIGQVTSAQAQRDASRQAKGCLGNAAGMLPEPHRFGCLLDKQLASNAAEVLPVQDPNIAVFAGL